MKTVKRIIKVIITVLLFIILSFNIFNFVSINILKNKLPTINGYAYLEVVSGSMEPKISIGDMIIIDTKVEKYQKNDIVTFEDINGSFVTHRILEINDNEVITKGDANNTIDEAINKDSIVGKYVYQIDGIGALMKSIRSPLTLIMILIIGILSCVLVSTDSKGNVILTEEEKEYVEFLEYKNNKTKKEKTDKQDETKVKKTTSSKKTTSKKEVEKKPTETKKTTSKKSINKEDKTNIKKKTETSKKETVTKKKVQSTKTTTKKEAPKKNTEAKKEIAKKATTNKKKETTTSKNKKK